MPTDLSKGFEQSMALSINNIRAATSEEWDSIWKECDYSTYFHSREWAELWQNYPDFQIQPQPKLIAFSDGKTALLPLSVQRSHGGLINLYVSSPSETFGGWISTSQLTVDHAVLLANFLVHNLGRNLVWRFNPYDELVFKTGIQVTAEDVTHALNLERGFEALFKPQSSIARKARKAVKEGVLLKTASTLEEWQEYYQVYLDSLQRWGRKWGRAASSGYPWELFQKIFHRNSPNIKLWVAWYENRIVSGAIYFYSKKHVVYWHGSSLEAYFHLRPANLVMYEVIKNCCERGYSWFDFNPSGGMEGVVAFKESFGAKPIPSYVVRRKSIFQKVAYKLVNSLEEVQKKY